MIVLMIEGSVSIEPMSCPLCGNEMVEYFEECPCDLQCHYKYTKNFCHEVEGDSKYAFTSAMTSHAVYD